MRHDVPAIVPGRPDRSGPALPAGRRPGGRTRRAFTLAELLVVIAIIGLLAAIGLPALRGLGESNAIDAATRQLLDDLAFARLRAINDRTTVYFLVVPPDAHLQVSNLAPYRLSGYTLYSRRSIGDQPGRHQPRQLIPWRNLPDKTFFALSKFVASGTTNLLEQPLAATNNFSLNITNRLRTSLAMSYLAFNAQGQLVHFDNLGRQLPGRDEYLALVKGSVLHPQNADGTYSGLPDFVEVPAGNRRYLRVNWLTGRSEVLGDLVVNDRGENLILGRPE